METKAFVIGAEGVSEVEAPKDLVQKIQAQEAARRTARERREALEARCAPVIETITIDGEEWHIKLLSWPDYLLASIMLGRDSARRLQEGDPSLLDALAVVALHAGVCSGPDARNPNHLQPYFSQEEAHAWAKGAATMMLAGQLFNAVMARNPGLRPSADPSSSRATTPGRSSSPAKKRRVSPNGSAS